jgi:UDP-N-acetylmuramoylalanine--D-glutamate ligase
MTPREEAVPGGVGGWSRALVYGLGLSGLAAARLLRSRGIAVLGVDRRGPQALDLEGEAAGPLAADPGVTLALGSEPEQLPEGIDGVVVSPGVPLDRPLLAAARRRGLPILAEVELAWRFLDGPLVGVTGSNGKSTTTALTGELLEADGRRVEVCGNIGVPLSSRVDGEPGRIFVTELSSFQLESISTLKPRAAAWLNLSPDHLDRHADLERYARAKSALFAAQDEDDVAVLNADDPYVAAAATRARRRLFSRRRRVEDGCYVDGDRVVEVSPGREAVELFSRQDLRLPGLHNLENAMAAALLARAMGAGVDSLRSGLERFRGLPHRLQPVAEREGVVWYDDSKGTNVDATRRSLEGFRDGSVLLILGGRNKGADLGGLREMVGRKARLAYFIGEAAEELQAALAGAVAGTIVGDLPRAVAAAAAEARPGEAVVLSPACASFDQYTDFRARGRHFQSLVGELGSGRALPPGGAVGKGGGVG